MTAGRRTILAITLWPLAWASVVFCQTLDSTNVTYNIDYHAGLPAHPARNAEDVLVVREDETIVLSWNAVTTTSRDSSQTWDTSPTWSNTSAMRQFKGNGDTIEFNQVLALPEGFWKFRIWSFYTSPGGQQVHSLTPSAEVGILVIAANPEPPERPVNFTIKLRR